MAFRPEGKSSRFFQRAIVRWETERRDGRLVIVAARLSCGHRYVYARTRPAGSKRTAAPCSECGAAYRTPSERARRRGWIRARLLAAVSQPTSLDALVEFFERWPEVRSAPAVGATAVVSAMDRCQRIAGLDDRPDAELVGAGPVDDDDEDAA